MIGLVPAQVPSNGVLDMALKKCGKSLFWLANIRNTSDVFKQLTFSYKIKYFNLNVWQLLYCATKILHLHNSNFISRQKKQKNNEERKNSRCRYNMM